MDDHEVKTRIEVGRITPPTQRITVYGDRLPKEDLDALIQAATGTGTVLLNTEHGPWRFITERSSLGSTNVFHLVSAGPPGR